MDFYINTHKKVASKIQATFGKQEEEELLYLTNQEDGQGYTLLVGLGKERDLTFEKLRNSFAKAIKKARTLKIKEIVVKKINFNNEAEAKCIQAIVEGMDLALYTFDKYKTTDKKQEKIDVYLEDIEDEEGVRKIIVETLNVTTSIKLARDMINEPSNKLYPQELANRVMALARNSGFEVEVLEEEEIKALGMEAFLTVGKGTLNKPRLIVMRHLKGGDKEVLGLVGKGLTCDTGGYSLKNSESLMYMKSDMSGAASVIGVMNALAKNNVPQNVIGVVATCENIVAGDSYKPGDIIYTMAGKSIEVLNTDAEGRLTLADALYYIIEKEKVTKVIDIATLTGVAGITFGGVYTALLSNNNDFYTAFMNAANKTEEDFWRLPIHKKYHKYIESEIADLKNTGGSGGGTITAGMFLQEFVKELPWIHLDIAATAAVDPPLCEYTPKGGTGVGIRTLYELIKNK